jgi:hypothetical protein
MLIAAVHGQIKGEHAVETDGALQNLRVTQCVHRVVVAGFSVLLHRQA